MKAHHSPKRGVGVTPWARTTPARTRIR
jgi:hypothetical protein